MQVDSPITWLIQRHVPFQCSRRDRTWHKFILAKVKFSNHGNAGKPSDKCKLLCSIWANVWHDAAYWNTYSKYTALRKSQLIINAGRLLLDLRNHGTASLPVKYVRVGKMMWTQTYLLTDEKQLEWRRHIYLFIACFEILLIVDWLSVPTPVRQRTSEPNQR